MTFTSIPDNYAAISAPLSYSFQLDEPMNFVDVKILDVTHDRVLGIKRLYDLESGEIDIAPYLKHSLRFGCIEGCTSIVDAEGLFVGLAVEVDGVCSEVRYFSPYPIVDGSATIFRAAAKQQYIAKGESDYIVIYAPNGGSINCELYAGEEAVSAVLMDIAPKPGLQILKILPEDFVPEADMLLLEITLDGVVDYLSYRIVPRPEKARRLIWSDKNGMVQFYTFPTCQSRRSRVEKQRIETVQGYLVTSCEAETAITLVSDYETVAEMERLGEILESESVWVDLGRGGVKVDVLSTESVVRYGGALNSLQVEIRPCDRKESVL